MRCASFMQPFSRLLQPTSLQKGVYQTSCNCHRFSSISSISVGKRAIFEAFYPRMIRSREMSTEQERNKHEKAVNNSDTKDSLTMKVAKTVGWLGGFYSQKAVISRAAKNIYECCADDMSYSDFQKLCKMPDTFQSWFLVLQLHVWMCLVRLKQDGRKGRIAYRTLVQIMWDDVEERIKALGVDDPSQRKDNLKSFVQEFYGLIVAYDEGLVSGDRVLASALWRNMVPDNKDTTLVGIAALTRHVRRQVQALDQLSSDELLVDGKIKWLPLETKYS